MKSFLFLALLTSLGSTLASLRDIQEPEYLAHDLAPNGAQ